MLVNTLIWGFQQNTGISVCNYVAVCLLLAGLASICGRELSNLLRKSAQKIVKLRLQLCHRACRFDLREWIYSLFSLTLPAAVGTLEVSTQVSQIFTPVCGMVALRGDLPVLVGDGLPRIDGSGRGQNIPPCSLRCEQGTGTSRSQNNLIFTTFL